jgi:protein-S-isoprenylcysteine O-methyltransferase Ste14
MLFFPGGGLVLYVASAALFWWCVSVTRGKLAACGQGCISATVLRSGPYRYIRHPFYLSYNLMWMAGYAATGWWVLAMSAAVMGCLYEYFAREEERGFLEGAMADDYRDYQLSAGRYWPRGRGARAQA